jgi:K+-transporting ATPase KdpF subunit
MMNKRIKFMAILPTKYRYNYWSIVLFLGLCSNLVLASLVYAATGGTFSKESAYAIGILLLVVFALSIYLFWVIFQPERF